MLKIKLTRTGKRGQAYYRIVVNEARSKRDGRYVDLLGHYNPHTNPPTVKVNLTKYQDWLRKGAQPTPTVASLVGSKNKPNQGKTKSTRPSKNKSISDPKKTTAKKK